MVAATNGRLFIHKYQPINLDDFGMDPEILRFLKTMIAMDNLNCSFIGNIASGKTTLMNALIREYYNGSDEKTYSENVLYINSLKEQGINYYRSDVKTFCQTRSVVPQRKKIVVLDDLDLINEQSQQVFRNCIDKFSHNVHFISSCCNVQKVIESLQSRFTMINIKPLSIENINRLLLSIKTAENIVIDDDAIEFIINVSNRTVKILINYMEKFKLINEPITLQLAHTLCSNISFQTFEDYTNSIKNQNINGAIQIIYGVFDKGYSVMDILDNYFLFVKNTDMLSEDEKYIVIPYICKYITMFHDIHEDEIELALFTNNLITSLCV
jgi:DNA polymerase III delta prime subunit